MVSGPWQFVVAADSSGHDRLFVVAPYHESHVANFWSGTNASMANWMSSSGNPGGSDVVINPNGDSNHPNVYTLDFLPGTREKSSIMYGRHELVYETTTQVLPSAIYRVLHQPGAVSRYAISLPAPDYVRTYSGTKVLATAESEISNTAPDGSISPAQYATWTVLHYGFQGGLPSGMSVMVDALNLAPVLAGTVMDGHMRHGLSISLVEAPLCDDQTGGPNYYKGYGAGGCNFPALPTIPADDQECDTLSGLSFALSTQLWGLSEYARFPEEKDTYGNQNFGLYDYDECTPYHAANVAEVKTLQDNVARHNFVVVDTARALAAIEFSLEADTKARLAKPARRSKTKEKTEDTSLSEDFRKIAADLEFLFQKNIPATVADAYYCVCKDTVAHHNSCGQLIRQSNSTPSCPDNGQAYFKTLVDVIAPADKGSSDCHAAQISINGAIQPLP